MNAHEIKALQVQITKAKVSEQLALEQYRLSQKEYDKAVQCRKSLEKKLAENSVNPSVSEHAILRYIERVYGIDPEHVRNEILTEPNIKAIATIRSGKLPLGNGIKAVIKDQTVVSIIST